MLSEPEPDVATSRTVDPTHHRNLKVMVHIERQASEAKPTIEYTSSASPIASTIHQTSEPPAQAGTDSSVSPPNELRDRASDSLGDDEASLVEAHKAMPLSKLRENDSTRPTEPGNASEDINSPATLKQTRKYVKSLKKGEQDQARPAISTSQILRNDADDNPENKYHYSPLPGPGSIRLLRLMPPDKNARIQCQLFDYPIQETGERACLYEALSYVWGSSDKPHSISIGRYYLPITANLYAALLHLRDQLIERIIWIDAICINQDDPTERAQQVQSMAKIYCKANRVIVWLGEAAADSDQALEEIRVAADEESIRSSHNEESQQAILALLQREWFQRIWVRPQTQEIVRRY
jgi:Heterokaryon incompatibility protein (HET)